MEYALQLKESDVLTLPRAQVRALLRSGADDRALLEVMERAIYQKPACHHFDAPACPEDEGRNMNQIGG